MIKIETLNIMPKASLSFCVTWLENREQKLSSDDRSKPQEHSKSHALYHVPSLFTTTVSAKVFSRCFWYSCSIWLCLYRRKLIQSIGLATHHLVLTYSVYGGWDRISLARPKSAILTLSLPLHKTFSGFKSLWKNPAKQSVWTNVKSWQRGSFWLLT